MTGVVCRPRVLLLALVAVAIAINVEETQALGVSDGGDTIEMLDGLELPVGGVAKKSSRSLLQATAAVQAALAAEADAVAALDAHPTDGYGATNTLLLGCADGFKQYQFQCQGHSSCTTKADGSADPSLANAISGDHATLVARRWQCRCTGCDPDQGASSCDLSVCKHVEAADATGAESQNSMVYYEFQTYNTSNVDETNGAKTVKKVEELFAAHQQLRTSELNDLIKRINDLPPASSRRLGEGETGTSCKNCDKEGGDADCDKHCGDWSIANGNGNDQMKCELLGLNEVDMMVKLYNILEKRKAGELSPCATDSRGCPTDNQGDPISINNKYMNEQDPNVIDYDNEGLIRAGGGSVMYPNVSDTVYLNGPNRQAGRHWTKKGSGAAAASIREDIVQNNLRHMKQSDGITPLLDVNSCQKEHIDPRSCSEKGNADSQNCYKLFTHDYRTCPAEADTCSLCKSSVVFSDGNDCEGNRDTEVWPWAKVAVRKYNNGVPGSHKEKFGNEGVPCKGKYQSCLAGFNIQRSQACNAVYAVLGLPSHDHGDNYPNHGVLTKKDKREDPTLAENSVYEQLRREFPNFRFAFQILTCSNATHIKITGKAVVSGDSGVHEYKADESDKMRKISSGVIIPVPTTDPDVTEVVQSGWCPDVNGEAGITKIDIDTAVRQTLSKVRFLAGELAAQDGKYWRQKLLNRILTFRDRHNAEFCFPKDDNDVWVRPDGDLWKNSGRRGRINWWYFNPKSDGGWFSRRYYCENNENSYNPYSKDPAALECGRDDNYNWEAVGATCLCDNQPCDPVTGIALPQPPAPTPTCTTPAPTPAPTSATRRRREPTPATRRRRRL